MLNTEIWIKNIQGEINEAGTSMEESIQRVVEGSNLANNAHIKLQEIESVSNQLAGLIRSISMATTQQVATSHNISKNMEEMGQVSAQNLTASRQTAKAMKQLTDTSKNLAASVETFKLGDGEVPQPVPQPDA